MNFIETGHANIDMIYDKLETCTVSTSGYVINTFGDAFVEYMENRGLLSVQSAAVAFIQGLARIGVDREVVKESVNFVYDMLARRGTIPNATE